MRESNGREDEEIERGSRGINTELSVHRKVIGRYRCAYLAGTIIIPYLINFLLNIICLILTFYTTQVFSWSGNSTFHGPGKTNHVTPLLRLILTASNFKTLN